jgi:TrmH family RNA methyltransferase
MKDSQIITSRTNPKVKAFIDLKDSKEHFFVEGYRIIEEILRANLMPVEVIYTSESGLNPITIKAKSMAFNFTSMSSHVFEKISDTKEPQGLAAFFKKPIYKLDDIMNKAGEKAIFLLLHEIQDPGNLGTIFRTARAAGVAAIILTKKSVAVTNTKVIRSSMGAVLCVPFIDDIRINDAISYLKNGRVFIAVTDLKSGENIYETAYKLPVCFVLGNEAHGLPEEILSKADFSLKIPIINDIESLNLSVSASVLMYDAVKRFLLYKK